MLPSIEGNRKCKRDDQSNECIDINMKHDYSSNECFYGKFEKQIMETDTHSYLALQS